PCSAFDWSHYAITPGLSLARNSCEQLAVPADCRGSFGCLSWYVRRIRFGGLLGRNMSEQSGRQCPRIMAFLFSLRKLIRAAPHIHTGACRTDRILDPTR